jgi:hypothetical protein
VEKSERTDTIRDKTDALLEAACLDGRFVGDERHCARCGCRGNKVVAAIACRGNFGGDFDAPHLCASKRASPPLATIFVGDL